MREPQQLLRDLSTVSLDALADENAPPSARMQLFSVLLHMQNRAKDLAPVSQPPIAENLSMPVTEEAVAWAEEAQSIADVLREFSDKFNGIDNGRCTVCRVGHRLWIVPGKKKGPCDYESCLSHRIEPILERYEPPSPETLERIRKNCEAAIRAKQPNE